jgi:DNA mismatch endonuclease (patch repair protein)
MPGKASIATRMRRDDIALQMAKWFGGHEHDPQRSFQDPESSLSITVPDSPGPSSRSANMRGIRRRDTQPERALRSELHQRGLRFRIDLPVSVEGRSPRPDVAFTRRRVAVFVDGCFWHGCREHAAPPRKNTGYWGPKIARNIERDREHDARLTAAGWTVIRVWEHERPGDAADRVCAALAQC